MNLEGLLRTKQTMRDKDVADRIILERALKMLQERDTKPKSTIKLLKRRTKGNDLER